MPALTEDLAFLVDAEWLASNERLVSEAMAGLGFTQVPGSCTFTSSPGISLDLVGYSRIDLEDRIGGGLQIPVMVYGDLSRVLRSSCAVSSRQGARFLTPPALAVVKLMTVRVEKGAKDKLHALLLVDENAVDPAFAAEIGALLADFPPDRVEDALADAQAATLSVTSDPQRADPQSRGYAGLAEHVLRGLQVLQRIVAGRER